MATKFPLQLNNLRFFVNPTQLNVTKGVTYGTMPTQQGVIYQVWYDSPEVLTITGASAGNTAYRELLFLKQNFERTNKLSQLFYKTRLYKGFITNMTIDHSTSHPNYFNYTITFQLLFGEKFAVEDFSITGSEAGTVLSGITNAANYINKKLNIAEYNISKYLPKIG